MWHMRIIFVLILSVFVGGCGGGGLSRCSSDKPLLCENSGTCCPRGYPYACGDGYCYQFGCPSNTPSKEICGLESLTLSSDASVSSRSMTDTEETKDLGADSENFDIPLISGVKEEIRISGEPAFSVD